MSLAGDVHWSGDAKFQPWVKGLVSMIEHAKPSLLAQALAKENEIESAIEEVSRLPVRDDCALYFYWNRIVATKPGRL